MKPLLLGLALIFVSGQVVSWADCCCGSFCQHKNACTGCGPEDTCPGGGEQKAGSKTSCCDEDESQPKKTCSHLEPSSEIDTVDSSTTIPTISEWVITLDLDLLPAQLDRDTFQLNCGPPRASPQGVLPLHLLLSVLLI